jgi:hypothetical protein
MLGGWGLSVSVFVMWGSCGLFRTDVGLWA